MEEAKAVTRDGGNADYCCWESDPRPEPGESKAGKATPEDGVYVLRRWVRICSRFKVWWRPEEGRTYWKIAVITGEEGDGEVEVVLGQETGLEVWTKKLLCAGGGGEGVVEPALGEGHVVLSGHEETGRGLGGGEEEAWWQPAGR